MRPLAKNIKKAREQKGWSQQQAARKLGLTKKAYAKYEEDRNRPKWDQLRVIMEYFEIKEQDMYPFVYNENFWPKKITATNNSL